MKAPSGMTPLADVAHLNRQIARLRKELLLAQVSLAAAIEGHPTDDDAIRSRPAFDRLLAHLQGIEAQGVRIDEYLRSLGATGLE